MNWSSSEEEHGPLSAFFHCTDQYKMCCYMREKLFICCDICQNRWMERFDWYDVHFRRMEEVNYSHLDFSLTDKWLLTHQLLMPTPPLLSNTGLFEKP